MAESLYRNYEIQDGPGFVIGIIKDGEWAWKKAYGMADLENGVPNSTKSVFDIASLSKQFTGLCIQLLREEGKLNLNASIRQYLPEMPVSADSISVSDLLHQTSGLQEYTTLATLAGLDLSTDDANEKLYRLLCRQTIVNFLPGSQFAYSNTNYFLLGLIVERISGMSLPKYSRKKIFDPLGMRSTFFHNRDTIIPHLSRSYSRNASGSLVNASSGNYNVVGAGNLYCTLEDFLLWDRNFYDNKLGRGTQDLIDSLLATKKLKNGTPGRYASGLFHGNFKGMPQNNHSGSSAGYISQYFRFPGQRFSCVLFANSSPSVIAYDLFDIYLLDSVKKPVSVPAALRKLSVPRLKFEKHEGYYSLSPGSILNFYYEDGRFYARTDRQGPEELVPQSDSSLRTVSNKYDLVATIDKSGNPVLRQHYLAMNMTMPTLKKINPPAVVSDDVNGKYYSADLDAEYEVAVINGELNGWLGMNKIFELKWVANDTYHGNGLTAKIERNGNKPTAFTLESGRVKNLRFKKLSSSPSI